MITRDRIESLECILKKRRLAIVPLRVNSSRPKVLPAMLTGLMRRHPVLFRVLLSRIWTATSRLSRLSRNWRRTTARALSRTKMQTKLGKRWASILQRISPIVSRKRPKRVSSTLKWKGRNLSQTPSTSMIWISFLNFHTVLIYRTISVDVEHESKYLYLLYLNSLRVYHFRRKKKLKYFIEGCLGLLQTIADRVFCFCLYHRRNQQKTCVGDRIYILINF